MKKIIIAALFSLSALTFISCDGSYIVTSQPVAPYYDRPVSPGPDYVWVDGDWVWAGGTYVWHNGFWDHPHGNRHWQSGSWENRGGGWHWNRGRWH